MKEYSFAYGKGAVSVPLDEHQVLGVLHGKEVAPLPDIRKALWESLDDPIDSAPLRALALEVQNGNIAGLVVDQAVGESLVATSDGGLEVANFTFTAEEASFGKACIIAKGNESFVEAVNAVIAQVTSDGSYQKAYDDAVALAASMGL